MVRTRQIFSAAVPPQLPHVNGIADNQSDQHCRIVPFMHVSSTTSRSQSLSLFYILHNGTDIFVRGGLVVTYNCSSILMQSWLQSVKLEKAFCLFICRIFFKCPHNLYQFFACRQIHFICVTLLRFLESESEWICKSSIAPSSLNYTKSIHKINQPVNFFWPSESTSTYGRLDIKSQGTRCFTQL